MFEVFRGFDNEVQLLLKDEQGVELTDHTTITRAVLEVGLPAELGSGAAAAFDSNINPEYFDLTTAAYTGLKLGGSGLLNGKYLCRMTTWFAASVNGYAQPDVIEILIS